MTRFAGAPERIPEPPPAARAPGTGPRPLAELEGWLQRNRTASIVGAGALVGGLALMARRKGAKSSSADAGAAVADGYTPASYSTSGSGYAASGGSYDSSSSDYYNAIEPQLEALGSRVDVLERGDVIGTVPTDGSSPTTAAPAPTPTPTAAAPKPATPVTTAKARATYQQGDTIWTFSARYGISATQLLTLNNLPQSTRTIAPGTSLRVQL